MTQYLIDFVTGVFRFEKKTNSRIVFARLPSCKNGDLVLDTHEIFQK